MSPGAQSWKIQLYPHVHICVVFQKDSRLGHLSAVLQVLVRLSTPVRTVQVQCAVTSPAPAYLGHGTHRWSQSLQGNHPLTSWNLVMIHHSDIHIPLSFTKLYLLT